MSPFFIGLMPMFSACCPYQLSMVTMFAWATARLLPASTRVCATDEPMLPPDSALTLEATCLENVCIMVMKESAAVPCHGASLWPASALACATMFSDTICRTSCTNWNASPAS
ncbi:hypothetical protein ACWD4J_35895 [Streptomyces sp. NPDC002577]